ncbi:hypothetical protein Ae201684P_019283 [Aphanomyces euteiches]|uniref:Uncharacterized protein n=1 Tax=Aphanomyces euteiches TaxID=100861 RepID=A0A6G0XEU4_9STRA|nr:hypothetical protein Ae201684_005654 [Aphanomyces euteiches]KAH9078189.1 hypothetical protein Ae201684P_019283 [Aphanomyces euteiches]
MGKLTFLSHVCDTSGEFCPPSAKVYKFQQSYPDDLYSNVAQIATKTHISHPRRLSHSSPCPRIQCNNLQFPTMTVS